MKVGGWFNSCKPAGWCPVILGCCAWLFQYTCWGPAWPSHLANVLLFDVNVIVIHPLADDLLKVSRIVWKSTLPWCKSDGDVKHRKSSRKRCLCAVHCKKSLTMWRVLATDSHHLMLLTGFTESDSGHCHQSTMSSFSLSFCLPQVHLQSCHHIHLLWLSVMSLLPMLTLCLY